MHEEKAINAKSDQSTLIYSTRICRFLSYSQYSHSVDFKQVEYYKTKMHVYVGWCATNIEQELHPTESSCYCLDEFCCNRFLSCSVF